MTDKLVVKTNNTSTVAKVKRVVSISSILDNVRKSVNLGRGTKNPPHYDIRTTVKKAGI